MKPLFMTILLAGLLVPSAWAQCGPNGCDLPPTRVMPPTRVIEKEKSKSRTVTKTPTRAWRYEHAVGHRAAVVRIECWDTARMRSLGSGVLVRWGKRFVVLTARHVIQDARQSINVIFHNGRKVKVRQILKYDARWDCAVLCIGDPPDDIQAAEMAYEKDAEFHDGDRLETCGYGPDGKLAVNSGLFIGYRRSSAAPQGPDDWMAVSGMARQGDSGGPVFDAKGRVVGVLWGTNGSEVVCVQPGRIHVMLNEILVEKLSFGQQRNPTPPTRPLMPVEGYAEEARGVGKDSLLPWRKDQESLNASQDRRIDLLIGLMEQQQQQQQQQPPAVDVYVGPTQPVVPPKPDGPPLWLWGSLGLLAAVGIFYGVQKN